MSQLAHELWAGRSIGVLPSSVEQHRHPGDLVNKVLEVDPDPADVKQVLVRIYDFPEDEM